MSRTGRPWCLGFVAAIVMTVIPRVVRADAPPALTQERLIEESQRAPTIELVTVGPGDKKIEKFGHAALCLRWPRLSRMDVCYNYGTADFERPFSMGWDFLRGRAKFWVEPLPRDRMLELFIDEDRSIWVQTFDNAVFSKAQRFAIARKLAFDARLENRSYVYHPFYDNCTTRVRDILNIATDGRLRANTNAPAGPSFRDYGSEGFAGDGWIVAAADFALGPSTDRQPTDWQAMFLPRILRAAVAEKLGALPSLIYQRTGTPLPTSGANDRIWIFLLAFVIALPAYAAHRIRRLQRLGLTLSTIALGLLGAALWSIALLSPVHEIRYNAALLLFWPTDLAVPWLTSAHRRRYCRLRATAVAFTSLLTAVSVIQQPLWMPIIVAFPVLMLLAFADTAKHEGCPRQVDSQKSARGA